MAPTPAKKFLISKSVLSSTGEIKFPALSNWICYIEGERVKGKEVKRRLVDERELCDVHCCPLVQIPPAPKVACAVMLKKKVIATIKSG